MTPKEPETKAPQAGAPEKKAASQELSPLRSSIRTKSGRSSSNVVLGAVLLMILVGGFAILLPMIEAKTPGKTVARSADPQTVRIGTVTLPADGDHCRRMELDNETGRMEEVGRVRCVAKPATTPEDAVRERYSGGRLDAIRKSFQER